MAETPRSALHGLISYFDRSKANGQITSGGTDQHGPQVLERWEGKVAVVTGASAGIGEAIAEALVLCGMQVVALARRENRLKDLEKRLQGKKGKLHPLKVDLTKEDEIRSAMAWIEKNVGAIHVLINNAGMGIKKKLDEADNEDWRKVFDLNVFALSALSRAAVKSMKEHDIDYGHIINVSSIAGRPTNSPLPESVPYFATKRAVNAISEGLRNELAAFGPKVKVTNLSPGLVQSEFRPVRVPSGVPCLEPEDIAQGVVYALSTPPHLVVTEMAMEPLGESDYTLAAMRYSTYKKT